MKTSMLLSSQIITPSVKKNVIIKPDYNVYVTIGGMITLMLSSSQKMIPNVKDKEIIQQDDNTRSLQQCYHTAR
jgi:hypothetical protein